MQNWMTLLGAGASVHAGLPTADKLTQAALEAASDQSSGRSVPYGVAQALNYVVAAIQLSDARLGIPVSTRPGIERLVSAVDLLAKRSHLEVSPFIREWDEAISNYERIEPTIDQTSLRRVSDAIRSGQRPGVRDIALRGLSNVLENELAKLVRQASQPGYTDIFRQLHGWLTHQVLADLRLPPDADVAYLVPLVRAAVASGTPVATLNYDLCFEEAARLDSIYCDRAVGAWDATGELTQPVADSARLLKLHGSIDWSFAQGLRFRDSQAPEGGSQPALVYGQRESCKPKGHSCNS